MKSSVMPSPKLAATTLALTAFLAACGGGGDASGPPDTTPPTVTITDNVSAETARANVTFTFTFSEAVSGFAATDVTVTNGTKGAFVMASDNRSATLVVTPTAERTGDMQVSVGAGTYTDIAGNLNTSPASAVQAFNTVTVTPGLIANGSFNNGTTGWSGNAANVLTEGGNSYNFANVTAAGNPWDVNLSYGGLNIPAQGVQYKLTFKASSNRTRALKAGIGLNAEPWTNVVNDVTLTTSPQTFELLLTSNFSGQNSRVIFDMGHDTGHVVIDDVALEVVR